jgi:hypothetical protein
VAVTLKLNQYSLQHIEKSFGRSTFLQSINQATIKHSAIFLLKTVLECKELPKIRLERDGASYIGARKKRFWNAVLACILRKSFRNSILACSITKIPLIMHKRKLKTCQGNKWWCIFCPGIALLGLKFCLYNVDFIHSLPVIPK